jgi:hypothetical protein
MTASSGWRSLKVRGLLGGLPFALLLCKRLGAFLCPRSSSLTTCDGTSIDGELQPEAFQATEAKLPSTGWTKGTIQRAFYGEKGRPGLPKNI